MLLTSIYQQIFEVSFFIAPLVVGSVLWFGRRAALLPIRLLAVVALAASLLWETIDVGSYAATHVANGFWGTNPSPLLAAFLIFNDLATPIATIALWTLCLAHAAQYRQQRWFVSLLVCAVASFAATQFLNNPFIFAQNGLDYTQPSLQTQLFLDFAPPAVAAVMPIVALIYSYRVRPADVVSGEASSQQATVSDDDFVVERIDSASAFHLPTLGWLKRW